MNVIKRGIIIILTITMLLPLRMETANAASVAGKTESDAIELTLGKKKTSSFWKGTANSLYYVVSVPKQGTISVTTEAKELGSKMTVTLRKSDVSSWKQSKTFSYNKKKKTTSGTIVSDYIMPKGNYIIELTPGKVLTKKKNVSISVKFKESKFDDVEPNNNEETAQPIKISSSAKTYHMYMTSYNAFEDQDIVDCMSIDVKKDSNVTIKFKTKAPTDDIKLLLREKTASGYNTVKTFDIVNGNLSEDVALKKGIYIIKIWNSNSGNHIQMPYTIQVKS